MSKGAEIAPAKDAIRPIRTVLEAAEERLAAVLPRHMSAAKQVQVVTTLVFKTPKLLQCQPLSILAAVQEASELGLSLSRSAGEAWLVPYFNKRINGYECQFQPGYRGLCKLAYQGGGVALIQGRIVREGEPFRYAYGPDLEFLHQPRLDDEESRPTHAYAFVKLASGERLVEVMTVDQVERVRRRSKSADEGPWITDWEEMARKTPLRRICKTLPKSEELIRAIEADEREYEDGPRSVVTAPPRGISRSRALAERLAGPTPTPAPEPEFREGTAGRIATEEDVAGADDGDDIEVTEAGSRG